jgi:hypothetical protein
MQMRKTLWAVATLATVAIAGSTAAQAAGGSTTGPCSTYHPTVPAPSAFVVTVDNPYFPLPVGRTLVYRGSEDGLHEIDRLHVTDRTKVIQGVTATVAHDVVWSSGHRQEITNDWYAQDDQGNVWYLGEDTRVLLGNGKVDRSGSWTWGVDGAEPGLIMESKPRPPDAYRQECLNGQAQDMAWTVGRGGSITVGYGTVHRILRSFEFSELEPNVVSEKIYAPGLGIVRERDLHGGTETFQLVNVRR